MKEKNWELAKKELTKASELAEDNAEIKNALGDFYLNLNDKDKALSFYEKAVNLEPQNYLYQGNLGSIYYQKKDLEKAEEHLKEALNLNPACEDIRFIYATLLKEKGETQKAIEEIERLYKKNPSPLYKTILDKWDKELAAKPAPKESPTFAPSPTPSMSEMPQPSATTPTLEAFTDKQVLVFSDPKIQEIYINGVSIPQKQFVLKQGETYQVEIFYSQEYILSGILEVVGKTPQQYVFTTISPTLQKKLASGEEVEISLTDSKGEKAIIFKCQKVK